MIDENMGRALDMLTQITSIVTLILLIPNAKYNPLMFSLATAVTGLNFYCAEIH